MKKILFSGIILAQLFMGCTSDLEESIDDLEQENEDLLELLEDAQTHVEANGTQQEAALATATEINAEITALEDRLGEISYEKVAFTHQYAYDDENSFTETANLYFSGSDYQYMQENNDGTYEISIYAWEGTEDDTEVGYVFTYDPTTEATEIDYYYISHENRYEDDMTLAINREDAFVNTQLEITSINLETGAIAATFTLTYTGESDFSEYGEAGEVTITFDGVLKQFHDYPDTELPIVITL